MFCKTAIHKRLLLHLPNERLLGLDHPTMFFICFRPLSSSLLDLEKLFEFMNNNNFPTHTLSTLGKTGRQAISVRLDYQNCLWQTKNFPFPLFPRVFKRGCVTKWTIEKHRLRKVSSICYCTFYLLYCHFRGKA